MLYYVTMPLVTAFQNNTKLYGISLIILLEHRP
nr:MAG TPA: hypothetical protein [Crassvirales sp.]